MTMMDGMVNLHYKEDADLASDLVTCINQELVSSPEKLQTHTDSEGHIAIILPAKGQYESVKGYLVDSEEFGKLQI